MVLDLGQGPLICLFNHDVLLAHRTQTAEAGVLETQRLTTPHSLAGRPPPCGVQLPKNMRKTEYSKLSALRHPSAFETAPVPDRFIFHVGPISQPLPSPARLSSLLERSLGLRGPVRFWFRDGIGDNSQIWSRRWGNPHRIGVGQVWSPSHQGHVEEWIWIGGCRSTSPQVDMRNDLGSPSKGVRRVGRVGSLSHHS